MGDIVGVSSSSWALEPLKTVQKEEQIGRMRSEHSRVTGKTRICHLAFYKLSEEEG